MSKIKAPANSVSGEGPLLGSYMTVFSLCPHMSEGLGELSCMPLIKAHILFMEASFS